MTTVVFLVGAILALATWASASPHVSFVPSHVMTQPDSTFQLSIRASASGDSISGCQLFLSFDPAVVELTEASEGTLYAQSGHTTMFLADELEPGLWRLFDTTFGPGTFVVPPGEIFSVTYRALDYGHTLAHIDTVYMSDEQEPPDPILGITWEHAHVFVVDPTGVEQVTESAIDLGPGYPNPFTTEARIPFHLPRDGSPRVAEIYDGTGRLVRRLTLATGVSQGEIVWDGRCDNGAEAASSVYFVMLRAGASEAIRLVKLR
jgi:hypothetical protein